MSAIVHEREKDLQQDAIQLLRTFGYIVLSTSVRKRSQTGQDKGIPDILVTHTAWPAPLWTGIELKGPKTPVSPAQQRLADDGRIAICRSFAEICRALLSVEDELGDNPSLSARYQNLLQIAEAK